MAIRRADVATPLLPQEAIQIDSLGGEVIVSGLMLKERLEMATLNGGFERVAVMLAKTVRDADQKPLFSAEEWEAFGAKHFDDALKLAEVAQRLSGMGGEKNA